MKSLPIYPTAPNAKVQVDQRDRWFAWGQGYSIFNSLLKQLMFMPFTAYNIPSAYYVDLSGNQVYMYPQGSAAGAMEGPVNYGSTPGTNVDYFSDLAAAPEQVDSSYPVVAIWVRNRTIGTNERWWIDRLSAGAPDLAWGLGLTVAGNVLVRLSADGTNVTNLNPTNPSDLTEWNFYAFQHRSATETNVIVNDQVTTYNTGLATIFTGGVSELRIGWYGDDDAALVALASDNSANVVQKLLGLFYHSRYAFRDNW